MNLFKTQKTVVTFILCTAFISFTSNAQVASDLFISEYGEGSSNNKYIEIFNGTGAPVDLSNYEVWKVTNGGTWPESTLSLSDTLDDGDVYVIANSSSDPIILGVANSTASIMTMNGDDAMGLAKDVGGTFTLIDAIGTDGSDPGSGWDVAGISNATANHTLVRKPVVCGPSTNWAFSAGTSTADSEWTVLNQNDWSDLGGHTFSCQLQGCSILGVLNVEMSGCDPGTNTYTQQITISYVNPPPSGTLDVNDLSYTIAASPQTVILTNLPADGASVDLNLGFSADTNCFLFIPAVWDAPNGCADPSSIVINEIDYDQPGADDAEFVELKNIGDSTVNLDNYELELVNGSGGGASVYQTLDLPDFNLAAGDYYVVCLTGSSVPNCDLEAINNIQNGGPDAVGLRFMGDIVDAVSYEGMTGAPYTEGLADALIDNGTTGNDNKSLSRIPDGNDTDSNNNDFAFVCATPGEANTSATSGCLCGLMEAAFTSTSNNLSVNFTNNSIGESLSWLWDFGDGNTSATENPGYSYQVAGTYTVCLTALDSCGADSVCHSVTVSADTTISLAVKMCLQGPYNDSTGMMNDDLRMQGLLPSTDPYSSTLSVDSTVLSVSGSDAIVDYVWIELRDAADSTNVLATVIALLQKDGDVVDPDGISEITLNGIVPTGNYYIAVGHRNHLATMTALPIALAVGSNAVDFTDGSVATYGTEGQHENNGKWMLWTGDVNGDECIKYVGLDNDRALILIAIGGNNIINTVNNVYANEDVNLDGVIRYAGANSDRSPILLNIGGSNIIVVRCAQMP